MYNDYMYAVQRDDEYLAHYGIKGMKWGVRKAVESGNSRALGRAYRKASRKLARLEKRANNGKKYAHRAALLGAGAAAAGGLAAAGTTGVARGLAAGGNAVNAGLHGGGRAMTKAGEALMKSRNKYAWRVGGNLYRAGKTVSAAGPGAQKGLYGAALATQKFGNSNTIGKALANAGNRGVVGLAKSGNIGRKVVTKSNDLLMKNGKKRLGQQIDKLGGVSNNTYARIGAGALGVGLAGAAGYNAYRAATTKRAARKAQEWRNEMNKAFAGTQYANGGGRKRRRRR